MSILTLSGPDSFFRCLRFYYGAVCLGGLFSGERAAEAGGKKAESAGVLKYRADASVHGGELPGR